MPWTAARHHGLAHSGRLHLCARPLWLKGFYSGGPRVKEPQESGRNYVGIYLPVPLYDYYIPTMLLRFPVRGPQSIPLMSKYPNIRYLLKSTIAVPNTEAPNTPYLGTLARCGPGLARSLCCLDLAGSRPGGSGTLKSRPMYMLYKIYSYLCSYACMLICVYIQMYLHKYMYSCRERERDVVFVAGT